MPLFREPPPPPPKANETLGEKAARLSRQPAPPPPGRGYALLAIAVITIGGLVYTSFTGGSAVTNTMKAAHEKAAQDAAKEEAAKPRADTPPVAPSPAATPVSPLPASGTPPAPTAPPPAPLRPVDVSPVPDPGPDTAATDPTAPAPGGPALPMPDAAAGEFTLGEIVPAVRAARAEARPFLRRRGLEAFANAAADPRSRRAALLEAARWGPDATPDEAELFARITKIAATDGLASPTDAQAALLYLGSLRDQGGVEAVILVENLVLDEKRPMELRVAAARVLPVESRPRITKKIAERPGPHPVLLSALK